MTEFVNLILQPVVDTLKVHVKKHIVYMTSCKKYVTEMERNMGELNAKRGDDEDHMRHNKRNKLKVPDQVKGWLENVQVVNAKVESLQEISVGSCFSFKTRHGVGKRAFGLIQEIKHLKEEHTQIVWTNHPIPLGKVDSMKASTSAPPVDYQSDFESREDTFVKALKALEADHKSHVIALWGMGGVGKTTMMEKLKTVVTEKRMFSLIVPVVIGEFPHKHLPHNHVNNEKKLLAIQDAVADYLAINLKEITTISARADKLRGWFENYSEGGKNKILVILDDVWQLVDLNNIGLTTLPNQGIDFKLLLTSRSRDVCIEMGVEANSIFNVKLLANVEAQRFFWKFINGSGEATLDLDLLKLGDDIVTRCQGLPIAIKTIASTLEDKSKGVWENTLTRLQHHDIKEIVNKVFEVSYNNLKDEQTKSVFLLCGLYPEDFDIPTEELVRYGWGLKLFNKVYTVREARNRLNFCIKQLVNANLLIESNRSVSIKMHDLVRAFVLQMYSKAEHASVVNDGNMSEWPANDTPDSCKRISLACNGMKEFPGDFRYPNLSFLKLKNGDKSLRFPENLYALMQKLQVIVYEKMQYPLLPGSFEYSINLRTLCLHGCSLMFDCHSIGSLKNLEVLSFANCSIQKLPSTIGNLKKLKLLDLTGCVNLHIDDGVLENLVKLEELYMRVADGKAIRFTDGNFNELAERSKYLSAIEIELFGNNTHPKRMSFNKLDRFKISIGRSLEEKDEKTTSFENTLMLVSNKGELLESGINMLFEKTDVLHLEVDDMNGLEDFECPSFHRLRVLNISKCAQLRYLFTRRVASTLSRQLEHLKVWSCDTLQTIIHDENNGSEPIKLPRLKFLSLRDLPKLAGLCNTGNAIELPQLMELQLDGLPEFTSIFPDDNLASSSRLSDTTTMQAFLNEKVAIPRLETLWISQMNKLSKIWSSEVTRSENVSFSMLKTIEVEKCERLVNVFPRNPMPLLHHLKELSVKYCDSIETIFKIDMECAPEITREVSSSLVSIVVRDSRSLRHVWSLENVDSSHNVTHHIHGFEAVESIEISNCVNFRNVFTPITADFNLKGLQKIDIDYGKISSVESSSEQQNNAITRDIAFSNHVSHTFHELRTLTLKHGREVEVVFDIESASRGELSTSQNNHDQLLPSLEVLDLSGMDNMSHVWKCNWNQFFILQPPKSLCQNLTKISLNRCGSIKYLFSPLMFKFLSNVKHVEIEDCEVMEEIVSSRDDEDEAATTSTSTHTDVTSFPILNMYIFFF
uniref:disease resistance protein At4g27190-like n=1 Tax=Erigeron canadensis TaxID=72917 RepID=UPI001CB95238|nr:disease resistance protein At4g27190-like [Erigeron canadensis]